MTIMTSLVSDTQYTKRKKKKYIHIYICQSVWKKKTRVNNKYQYYTNFLGPWLTLDIEHCFDRYKILSFTFNFNFFFFFFFLIFTNFLYYYNIYWALTKRRKRFAQLGQSRRALSCLLSAVFFLVSLYI